MTADTCEKKGALEWCAASRPFPGQEHCGDCHLVTETKLGWLLAVADGLGHGPEAALASRSLIEVLRHNIEEPPVQLLRLCHNALKNTRGSAATVVTIDRRRCLLSWAGVGNVEAVIRHANPALPKEYITMRGGIIGARIPGLQASFLQLEDGDILVLATDGIDSRFVQAIGGTQSSERLAGYLLDRYAKPSDDALVLVARYSFSSPGGITA